MKESLNRIDLTIPHNILAAQWQVLLKQHHLLLPDFIEINELDTINLRGSYSYGPVRFEEFEEEYEIILPDIEFRVEQIYCQEDKLDNIDAFLMNSFKDFFSEKFLQEYSAFEYHPSSSEYRKLRETFFDYIDEIQLPVKVKERVLDKVTHPTVIPKNFIFHEA